MALDYSSPDWEDEQLQRQIALATKLRQQSLDSGGEMRGRIYVRKDPWENFVQGLAGSMLENRATGRQQSRQQADEQALRDWAARTPQMTEGMTPLQMGEAQRRHAQEGLALRSPLARSLAVKGYDYAMTAPEKQAQYEAQIQARKDAQAEKLAAATEKQRRDIEDKIRHDQEVADRREFEIRLSKSLQQQPRDQYQIIDTEDGKFRVNLNTNETTPVMANGKVLKAAVKGAGGTVDKAAAKTASGLDDLIEQADVALQGLPYASGAGSMMPQLISQYYTSPQTQMADANIASLTAEKAHQLYGSAFSGSEQTRAAQFLPKIGDKTTTLQSKLTALKAMAEKKRARMKGEPDPHPNMYNEILDPVTKPIGAPAAPGGGGAPTVVKRQQNPKTGQIREVLSDGTTRLVQ